MADNTLRDVSRCVLVMAKPPNPGVVKTRLIPALGAEGACALYQKMLAYSLAQLQKPARWALQLWGAGTQDNPAWLAAGIDTQAFAYHSQQGDDLGERMHHAMTQALENYQQIVIVGTDCPGVDADYIANAFSCLSKQQPVVIGPASDGGYVLLGMHGKCVDVFRGVEWSTDRVLLQTQALLRKQNLQWQLLPVQHDVDTADDLHLLPAFLRPE